MAVPMSISWYHGELPLGTCSDFCAPCPSAMHLAWHWYCCLGARPMHPAEPKAEGGLPAAAAPLYQCELLTQA